MSFFNRKKEKESKAQNPKNILEQSSAALFAYINLIGPEKEAKKDKEETKAERPVTIQEATGIKPQIELFYEKYKEKLNEQKLFDAFNPIILFFDGGIYQSDSNISMLQSDITPEEKLLIIDIHLTSMQKHHDRLVEYLKDEKNKSSENEAILRDLGVISSSLNNIIIHLTHIYIPILEALSKSKPIILPLDAPSEFVKMTSEKSTKLFGKPTRDPAFSNVDKSYKEFYEQKEVSIYDALRVTEKLLLSAFDALKKLDVARESSSYKKLDSLIDRLDDHLKDLKNKKLLETRSEDRAMLRSRLDADYRSPKQKILVWSHDSSL